MTGTDFKQAIFKYNYLSKFNETGSNSVPRCTLFKYNYLSKFNCGKLKGLKEVIDNLNTTTCQSSTTYFYLRVQGDSNLNTTTCQSSTKCCAKCI